MIGNLSKGFFGVNLFKLSKINDHDDFARSITDATEFVMRHCTGVNQGDRIHLDRWHVFYVKMTEWSAGSTPPTTVEACMLIAASNFDIKVASLLCLFVVVLATPMCLPCPCACHARVPNEHYKKILI